MSGSKAKIDYRPARADRRVALGAWLRPVTAAGL